MDVLELPRPVINFLRTMAKEGCRYVLSWDIFGGTDAVTLTLTWKLNNDPSPQPQVSDDLRIRPNESISSPRHSRRDQNRPTSAKFRPSRGKSLEENNQTPNKQSACRQSQVASLERSTMINRQQKQSDPIYDNLCYIKSPIHSSPLNDTSSLSLPHPHHRQVKQQCETSILRKTTPSTPIAHNSPSQARRTNHLATRNDVVDDDDDTLDPWVKRFEYSLKDPIQKSQDDLDRTRTSSGKVKFKRTPDYF